MCEFEIGNVYLLYDLPDGAKVDCGDECGPHVITAHKDHGEEGFITGKCVQVDHAGMWLVNTEWELLELPEKEAV